MKASPDGDPLHLDRILELIGLISTSLSGLDQKTFICDRDKGDVVALRLAAIGEASRKLSPELRGRHPHIPWSKMYTLRNIVAHHYFDLNYDLLWDIAAERLPELEAACRAELKRVDG